MQKSALVVDDNVGVRSLLVELLTREGFAVISGGSGEEALSALKTFHPTVIILDMKMPGMHCTKIVDQIMAIDKFPLILISAYDDFLTLKAIQTAYPHVRFLSKPFDIGLVRTTLYEALESIKTHSINQTPKTGISETPEDPDSSNMGNCY